MRHFWWFNTVILVTSIFFKAKKKGRITLNLMVHTTYHCSFGTKDLGFHFRLFKRQRKWETLSAQTFFMSGPVNCGVLNLMKFNHCVGKAVNERFSQAFTYPKALVESKKVILISCGSLSHVTSISFPIFSEG